MSFNSLSFAVFFPIVAAVYFILPQKVKNIWLLAAGYFLYLSWELSYGLILAFVSLVTYIGGRLLEKRQKKGILLPVILLTLLPLLIFKYLDFFIRNINFFTSRAGLTINDPWELILPVGISFYTFQALGYVIDVYRKKISAEKDPVVYFLFVSFFPLLLSGPIERAGSLIPQFRKKHVFDADRILRGFLLMLWGFFLKMVVSDRLSVYVNAVFEEYKKYNGVYVILAICFFSLQIYCDFAGYSNMARGCGEIMGFDIIQNFRQSYLATSVADFWRRWHISLTSWFRDYIYIPLGGNKKGAVRKYINILAVFAISGLWHGASWNFVFWGVINGVFQVAGGVLKPLRDKAVSALKIDRSSFGHRCLKTIATFIPVAFAWTFFKAPSFMTGVRMIREAFRYNPWVLFDKSLYKLGLNELEFSIMTAGLFVLLAADIINENGIVIRDFVKKQALWFRWLFYVTAIVTVVIFGVYGPGYDAADFIYFKF